jgi:16S rRNA processing protein RimM
LSALDVARVGRPHGLRGAFKVELHWSASTSLFELAELNLQLPSGEQRAFRVESISPAGKSLLVKLAGVDDRDAALALRGSRVLVERSALPPLAEGEAYLVDLVGSEVHAPDGPVGEVIGIEVHPSVDALVIRCPDGKLVEQALIPAFVARIDGAARRIELSSRDGLIE